MLTVFAKPNRRFRTDHDGLRFWLDPISFQSTHSRPNEATSIEVDSFNINLIFEDRSPLDGFRSYLRSVPEQIGSVVTAVSPMALKGAIFQTRFLLLQHKDLLVDIERSFDSPDLNIAITWTDSANHQFDDFLCWLSGSGTQMPEKFWLSQVPDISLVRRVP